MISKSVKMSEYTKQQQRNVFYWQILENTKFYVM